MSGTVISVESLGKEYVIGGRENNRATFREMVVSAAAAPFRRMRHLRGKSEPEERIWALKDVSFEVKDGEVVGIVGRNGAGKSTLLKILSRVTAPTAGRVTIRGRVSSLLEVGTGFHPELTGRENIYLNGAILGMSRAEINRKFDEIVDFSGVEKFLETPVKRYSSGMQVRLAFAVAAHLEPEILIVDEVLAVGDAEFQKKSLGKMGAVAKSGRTVLFVSHNTGAVGSLCQVGLWLDQGRLIASGPIQTVIARYLQTGSHSKSYFDLLSNRPTKSTNCSLITHVDLGSSLTYLGEPFSFRIGYQFSGTVRTPQFVARFLDAKGETAFCLHSDYQENDIPRALKGSGEIVCEIPALPLLPGTYALNLRLWTPGEKLDEIENAAQIRVEWRNPDNKKAKWGLSLGSIYVDAKWTLATEPSPLLSA